MQLRGFRIELGEVEAALLQVEGVAQSVAAVVVDERLGERLVGYVVPRTGCAVDAAAAIEASGRFLPEYMVPDAVVVLEALPLTANGKLDRRALPAPEFTSSSEFRAVSSPVEEIVAGVFAEVLGVERVGADDSFFALGGNSLLATKVAARLGAAFDTKVPVRTLFEAPTVEQLAVAIGTVTETVSRPPITAGDRPERIPLSLAQQRMWFLNQMDTTSPVYNIPMALRLKGALDRDAIDAAVADLVARHESLRTRYPSDQDGPYQEVLAPEEAGLSVGHVRVDSESDLFEQAATMLNEGFDVTQRPPVRVRLFELGAEDHVLAFVVHHITADGESMAPLGRDMMTAYLARTRDAAPGWKPLPVQYADYALWQRTVMGDESDDESLVARQLAYWRDALAGMPQQIDLPTDRPRTSNPSPAGGSVRFTVGADVQERLTALARAHNATLFMVVHSALAVLVTRLSGARDFAIGTPVAGRGISELDDLVGMFVNTLPLRTSLDPSLPFAELVDRVRTADLEALDNADLPFERIVDEVVPKGTAAPLIQVVLSVEPMGQAEFTLPGLTIEPLQGGAPTAKFDLQLTLADNGNGFVGEWIYAADLFDRATVEKLSDRFVRVLDAVTTDSSVPVGDVEILSDEERRALTSGAAEQETGTSGRSTRVVSQLFTANVEQDPEAPAVSVDGDEVTYREIDRRSSQIARLLIEEGIGTGDVVGVVLDGSVDGVCALWAVLKSGAAFLVLDPSGEPLPEATPAVELVLSRGAVTGHPRILDLTDPAVEARVDEASAAQVTYTDRLRGLTPDDPAWVHVSGSRVGVVDHGSLAGWLENSQERFGVTYESRLFYGGSGEGHGKALTPLLAGAAGAAYVTTGNGNGSGDDLTDVLADEWVTHAVVGSDAPGKVDTTSLDDLECFIVEDTDTPAEDGSGAVDVVALGSWSAHFGK
ncbi:condensation domain-containing protein [Rhodococcus sp. Z13]|uniref:Condensation domain-containing protein n=1 Tax=Rhodococcus sacchari TaxID=2962047 RepID=A0ACD4DED3_9NOCA|nr:condensation domain-containing protein [Rhodococcus sp. Z13]UYP18028.1 condensation domain-containing protein [Rhodococcus sp. Z13]